MKLTRRGGGVTGERQIEFTGSHSYPNSKALGKGCVGNEKTHLVGCRENDVIRGNPGFSWDKAEKGVFEKEVPNF